MRLSYFTQSVHPPAKDYRRVLHEDSEVILLADELDYVESFLGRHITDRNDKMLQSINMMLACGTSTPTSITVVAANSRISPRSKRAIVAARSSAAI